MTVGRIEANGLRMELTPRHLSGRLIGGWYLRWIVARLVQLPALALGTLVLAPSVWSVAVVACSPRYRFIAVCCGAVVCAVWTWRRVYRSQTPGRPREQVSDGAAVAGEDGQTPSGDPAAQADPPQRRWIVQGPEVCVWLVWLAGAVWAGVDFWMRGSWGWAAVAAVGAVLFGLWHWPGHWYTVLPLPCAVIVAGSGFAFAANVGREAYVMTLVWVVLTGALLILTVWTAWRQRRRWWPWWPLVMPFGISAFVAGLAWRLIVEQAVDRVTTVRAQEFLYALMLGAAFAWIWFGALFVLLRAAAEGIESDPVRRADLARYQGWQWISRLRHMLNPVIMIVGLVVVVAAARVFDIILVAVPGPQQYTLDSVTVHWWHLPSDTAADHVAAAAFSLPLAVVVGLVAWLLQSGIGRHHSRWPVPAVVPVPVRWRLTVTGPADSAAERNFSRQTVWTVRGVRVLAAGWAVSRRVVTRVAGRAADVLAVFGPVVAGGRRGSGAEPGVAESSSPDSAGVRLAERWLPNGLRVAGLVARVGIVLVFTLSPVVVLLVMTWTGFDGPALTGPGSIWGDGELWHGLMNTGVVAVVATFLTVTAAVPPAYYAATLRPDRLPSRLLMTFLVVFAVLPAQVYLGPIRALISRYGLSGTSIPLILMHAAIGLPIAIMILRGALLAPADGPLSDTRREPASTSILVRGVLHSAGPALVAVSVLQLVQVWNDFFIGLQMRGADASPWSLLLWSDARQFHESTAHLAAGALLSAVPPVVLLLATWRRFLVPGLTGGALR